MGDNSNSADADYYEILNCNRNAGFVDLKKSYQRLAILLHPDKRKGHKSDLFLLLQKAWSVLRNPETRRQYDAQLSCQEHSEVLLYATISIKEMKQVSSEGDGEGSIYIYSCRCGGTYLLEVTDSMPSKVIIGCDECSFSIEINL